MAESHNSRQGGRVRCSAAGCRNTILPETASRTSGICMPCFKKPEREAEAKARRERPSFFGGLGAGKGWLQTDFLVSPEELRSIIEPRRLKLCVTNASVNSKYEGTPISTYINSYRRYFEHIFSGQTIDGEVSHERIDAIEISLFDRDDDILFEKFSHKGSQFRRAILSEPRVGLSPCMINWSGSSISLRTFNGAGYIGLCASIPRVYFSSGDDFREPIETFGSPPRVLYESLVEQIKTFCGTRKFSVGSKRFRPKLLVSDRAAECINRHSYLLKNGISVG